MVREKQIAQLHTFVTLHGRFPERAASSRDEKSLAVFVTYLKKRARGKRGKNLSETEKNLLHNIPGWTWSRWERGVNTGTRKGQFGWEARIRVLGKRYHGPPRSTRAVAREDYTYLRLAAESSMTSFKQSLHSLKANAKVKS